MKILAAHCRNRKTFATHHQHIILGDIYGGIFTPTEAATVTVFYAMVVGLVIYREISCW